MKIRKPENVESTVGRTEAKKTADPRVQNRTGSSQTGEEVGRVEIALGRELNNIAELTNPKVAELKKIFAEEGVRGLNARYKTEDVAAAFAREVGSFVNDFRERESNIANK